MLVSDIMTTNPRAVSPDTKLLEVASIMCLYRIPALPVVDEEGLLVGNISEMDVLKNLLPNMDDITAGNAGLEIEDMIPNYTTSMDSKADDIMVRNPVSVSPDEHVLRATARMTSRRFRRIPVTDKSGKLMGVMSLGDVHKAVFQAHLSSKA